MRRTEKMVLAKEERRKVYMREYLKVYQQNPVNKAKRQAFNRSTEGKERNKKYHQMPKSKEATKMRTQNPIWKENQRKYQQSPRAKAMKSARMKVRRKTLLGKAEHSNIENRRRASMKNSDITNEWLLDLSSRTMNCSICSLFLGTDRHLDHIWPLNPKCNGTHTMANVRYVHAVCNLRRPNDGSDVLQYLSKTHAQI